MIEFSCFSSKGERLKNEDFIRTVDKNELKAFILADGLGGQGMGDMASSSAVNAVEKYILENDFSEEMLDECFKCAQNSVLKSQEEADYKEMRTTLVILIIYNDKAYFGHIGDSRLYVFDGYDYDYRTSDHSIPQMLLNMGEIKEEEIRHHPDRNKLIKALGSDYELNDEYYSVDGKEIDIKNKSFLLCSDGFWEWIVEEDMEKFLLKAVNTEHWLNLMADRIINNGIGRRMDNFSAIAVKC